MKLSDIEQQVLKLRNSGLSLQEVARVMGWKGREKVRQVEARARRKAIYLTRAREGLHSLRRLFG